MKWEKIPSLVSSVCSVGSQIECRAVPSHLFLRLPITKDEHRFSNLIKCVVNFFFFQTFFAIAVHVQTVLSLARSLVRIEKKKTITEKMT